MIVPWVTADEADGPRVRLACLSKRRERGSVGRALRVIRDGVGFGDFVPRQVGIGVQRFALLAGARDVHAATLGNPAAFGLDIVPVKVKVLGGAMVIVHGGFLLLVLLKILHRPEDG